MQRDPPTATPESSIARAIQDMHDLKTDCLPVVVGERLVGILTLRDLVKLAAKYFGGETQARAASQSIG
jgi:CBS domain-containing protein